MAEEELEVAEGTVEEPKVDLESEKRARLSGWTPKEEFRGDPERWVDASEWNERTDKIMPILKNTNRKLEEKLGATEKRLLELEKTLKSVAAASEKISEREYNRALETIRQEQARAIADGDSEAWSRLETQKDKLQRPEKITVPEPKAQDATGEFKARNSEWYGKVPEMTGYAHYMCDQYAAQGLSFEEQLSNVERDVREKFKDFFGNTRRSTQSVSDPTDRAAKPPAKRSYASLPKEAKEVCDSLVASIQGYTREQYVKDYDWD